MGSSIIPNYGQRLSLLCFMWIIGTIWDGKTAWPSMFILNASAPTYIMHKLYKKAEDSEVTLTELMLPSHSNFSGKIHGGFILSLMDKAAFSSASKFSGHYCVTASVNRVDFLNAINVGELVTLKSRVNYVGHSSMVVGIRVESQNIQTGEIKHCNSSFLL